MRQQSKATPEQVWIGSFDGRMPFGKVIVAIASTHARQIWAMLAHDIDNDPCACLNHPMHQQTCGPHDSRSLEKDPIHRQRDTVDNRSDHPGANLTNQMDVHTVLRLIPAQRTVR